MNALRIGILIALLPAVAVAGGWSFFGLGEPDGPPTEEDIKKTINRNRVERLTCQKAEDERGGYMCHFITESSGIFGAMARFNYANGEWQASKD